MTVKVMANDDLAGIAELVHAQNQREGTEDGPIVLFDALIGLDRDGRVVAVGWENRSPGRWLTLRLFWVQSDGGNEVLAALVDQAKTSMSTGGFGDWMRIERVLRPETAALPRETTAIYQQHGFSFLYVELEMARPLVAQEAPPILRDVSIVRWTPEEDAAIREVYNDAFSTRGFNGYAPEDWSQATFSIQDDFLPFASYLALDGDAPVGFSMCVGDGGEGWIDSVGVRPGWRGRGIAGALLLRSMQAMREAGIKRAVLRVNEDNPRAIAVYRRLGFEVRRKHVVWRKAIAAP